MKRSVPVFVVVFLYSLIFVKICFNLSDIINNQRVFRQKNFLRALNKLTSEIPFNSIHENYDFIQFSDILKAMKKPPYVLIYDSSNIDVLLNHICNLQYIPNALSRIVAISYDQNAHDLLQSLHPTIPSVVVDLERVKETLPEDIENRKYLIYTLALLTHTRICASLALRGINFWSMHQDTLWIENFESMNIEERYPNAHLLFDTIGNDYLPEYTRMQDWICGSTFFVRAGPVTQQFFMQVEAFMLSYQSPDSSVFSYLCGHYQYKCHFLPKWTISSFDYFKGPRDHPPVLIQMDASKRDGETKMDLFRKYGFVFRHDNGSCNEAAFHKLRSFNSSIYDLLPDPSRRLDSGSESDVEGVIDAFLNSGQSLCGAMIPLLVKRDNNNDSVDKFIDTLNAQNIAVQSIRSYNVSGGKSSCPMYELSSQTNGLYVFAEDEKFYMVVDGLINHAFPHNLLYSTHLELTGNGSTTLPSLFVPIPGGYNNWVYFILTVSNDGSINNFHYLDFTFTDVETGNNATKNFDPSSIFGSQQTNSIFATKVMNFAEKNTVSLAFDFLNNYTAIVDLRIYLSQTMPNWIAYENRPITSAPRCVPDGRTTFLFGYSNNFNATIVSQVKDVVVQALTANPRTNVKFADVRFNTNNGYTIYYHDNVADFSASVQSHLPEPSLLDPPSNDTDAFEVIDTFLNEKKAPLCKSTVFFLNKRYCLGGCPSWENTIPGLINQRITTNFIQSMNSGDGGLAPPYLTSDYTNGLIVNAGVFWSDDDSILPQVAQKLMDVPYTDNLLYADYNSEYDLYGPQTNITGLQLSPLCVPEYIDATVNVTLTITTESFGVLYFQSITLHIIDRATKKETTLYYDRTDQFTESDLIMKTISLKSGSVSDVYMDYETKFVGNVQIRMYIDRPVPDNWVSPPVIKYAERPVLRVKSKH